MVPTKEMRLDKMENKQLLEAQYENRASSEQHSIFIQGRLWRDKVNGNTYWSTRTEIDGKHVLTIGMEYGYGDSFIHETIKDLSDSGKIPTAATARELRDLGWTVYTCASYGLKREMFKVGA